MAKKIVLDSDSLPALLADVEQMASAVRLTLGPQGRNVVLDKNWGSPTVTKDGVTVVENINLEEGTENLSLQLLREVAGQTAKAAGDGTTTATLLAEAIFSEGLKRIAASANPMALSRGISKAVEAVTASINELATPVTNEAEVQQVATIAGDNDSTIGNFLVDAFRKVGPDGVLMVEAGPGTETKLEMHQGMQLDRGFLSPHFITNLDEMSVEFDNCLLLLVEGKISSIKKLVPLLEAVSKVKKPLLIIADDVEGEALATLVVNKLRGILGVCAIKTPGYGERRNAILADLEALTGSRPIYKDSGIDLSDVKLKDLGTAEKVLVRSDDTIIVGSSRKEAIDSRITQIRSEIDQTNSEYDRVKLQERLTKLAGGVGRIFCGADTEKESNERKARMEDAIAATRAALQEGIVPGGGVALLRSAPAISKLELSGDEAIGAQIIRNVLNYPLHTIATNAGKDGAIVVDKVHRLKGKNDGFDAHTGEYGNLLKAGIIDPAKVVKTALKNAASVASLLLTTDSLIADGPPVKGPVGTTGGHSAIVPGGTGAQTDSDSSDEKGPGKAEPPESDSPVDGGSQHFFNDTATTESRTGRHVNVWMDESSPPVVDVEFKIKVDIGQPKSDGVGGGEIQLPDWGDREKLPLLLALNSRGADIFPAWHRAVLPRQGPMNEVTFRVTAFAAGPLKMNLTIFLDEQMLLLERYDFVIDIVAKEGKTS